MKKCLAALLCLVIMLLPMTAFAAEGDLLITTSSSDILGTSVMTACGVGDTLYIMTYDRDAVFAQKAGESTPTKYTIDLDLTGGENGYTTLYLLSDGTQPYLMVNYTDYSGETNVSTLTVYSLTFADGQASTEAICAPDWNTLDVAEEYFYINSCIGVPGGAMLRTYSNWGDGIVYFLNYSDGSLTLIEDVQNVYAMTAYTDNRVLFETFDYSQMDEASLLIYDPADGSVENVVTFTVSNYNPLDGLAADTETGDVYCIVNGEIRKVDLTDGSVSDGISSMPLDISSSSLGYILTGGWYAFATYDGYTIRNLNAESQATKRLVIADGSYTTVVNNGYYQYVNEHGDTNVILTRDSNSFSNLVESMMNKDSSVDVYILPSTTSDYSAVHDRGYMAELGNGEALTDLYNNMNEGIKQDCTVNGAFSALPIDTTYWSVYVNPKVLAKLGVTVDDVPTNWSDMLDFLKSLEPKFSADSTLSLFDPYTSTQYARMNLFEAIFQSYQALVNVDAQSVSAQTLVEILNKLDALDFAALGQPTDEEIEQEDYDPGYDTDSFLMTTNMGTSLDYIISDSQYPMIFSLTADTPAYLEVDCYIAFINPYTTNLEGAQAFMETLCSNLEEGTLYGLRTDKTEPYPNPNYESTLKDTQDYVDQVQKQLDEADEADKQAYEEQLKDAQASLEYVKGLQYLIDEETISWIAAHAQNMVIKGQNWLYSDSDGECYNQVSQYTQGLITAQELVNNIDAKIRMMILEGN